MQCTGLVASRHVRSQLLNRRLNPCPRHWKVGFLTTRQSGKSLHSPFFKNSLLNIWTSLVAQSVKSLLQSRRPPTMQETGVNPWVQKIPWRREQKTTPIVLPGEFHEQRSLVGYSPWGRKCRTQLSN